jgi:NADH-quinone oxidoreductase subunit L
MTETLHLFILIPLAGFAMLAFVPKHREKLISWISFLTIGLQISVFLCFLAYWLSHEHKVLSVKDRALFHSEDFSFYIDLFFDYISAVYLLVGCVLTFLVTVYSRYYLHREQGYKRFFNTILLFYAGYNIAILAGNLETLFLGWEILGITSFLLIAFYRDRYLPAKNALKVFSIYRVGDVGLILAIWLNHGLWHSNITFLQLENHELAHEDLLTQTAPGIFISLMLLLTAAAKSAQLPFSSWLPRAMEGPTPSSAIFYGSLSVHLGVFVLLRTHMYWENQPLVRLLIGVVGISTSVVASTTARVQASIKSQVGYASVAQIGLIFVELACGLVILPLVHFAGNAFLRTYQLLVSPSIVAYRLREQSYSFTPKRRTFFDLLPSRLRYSLYVLGIKEWNLELLMFRLWSPLKIAGRHLGFGSPKRLFSVMVPLYLLAVSSIFLEDNMPAFLQRALPGLFALAGLMLVLIAFTERKNALSAWLLIVFYNLWVVLAVFFNERFTIAEAALYLSGILVCGGMGYLCLRRLEAHEGKLDLLLFQGHLYEHPKNAFVFLLCSLGLMGFPITPTFIGEDVIFNHIHPYQVILALCVSTGFIVGGIALVRLYARLFLGPHVKTYHERAYRSS